MFKLNLLPCCAMESMKLGTLGFCAVPSVVFLKEMIVLSKWDVD